tara:strand:- start:1538 stop:1969 length:432 start_codon:yes stop_codon:yes gene_type:complete
MTHQSISITKSILDARGNRNALLDLVNDKTLESLQEEKPGISPQSYASELAMSLFDSKAVTIRWEQVIYSKSIKRRYDLTRGDHAVRALKEWALMNKSLNTYLAVGEDQRAYNAIMESNRKQLGKQVLYGGIPTSLKLTRHRK